MSSLSKDGMNSFNIVSVFILIERCISIDLFEIVW
jgi:hypothetical protein